jgi:hypothetical protein
MVTAAATLLFALRRRRDIQTEHDPAEAQIATSFPAGTLPAVTTDRRCIPPDLMV